MFPVLLKMLHGARKSTLPANSPPGYIAGRENVRRRPATAGAVAWRSRRAGTQAPPATAGAVAPGRRRGRARRLQGRTSH